MVAVLLETSELHVAIHKTKGCKDPHGRPL